MSPAGGTEFDNTEYQKRLAKTLLEKISRQPDKRRTPSEIYEEVFEPLPRSYSEELVKYVVEKMVQHSDGVIDRCNDDSDQIQIVNRRVGEYIKVHLETDGDPFPEVDPEPFQEQSS